METAYGEVQSRGRQVGVSGGVEHVALLVRMHYETGNWIIQIDASNAFRSVLRKPMLEQVAACLPVPMGFVAKCYIVKAPPQLSSRWTRENELSSSAPVGRFKETLWDWLCSDFAAAGASEGLGGMRVAGGRNLCVTRRHHYRCPRDIIRDGGAGALPRACSQKKVPSRRVSM